MLRDLIRHGFVKGAAVAERPDIQLQRLSATHSRSGRIRARALRSPLAVLGHRQVKLYIWSFRDRGAFHEAVTNEIAEHLVAATQPRFLRLAARFNVRGGIHTSVVVEHRQPGWQPAPSVALP